MENIVEVYIERARQYGMEIEILQTALELLNNNSALSVKGALEHACYEWDV
jgi:hypothetical protein